MKHLQYGQLTQRQREVLGAIVQIYVGTARPISSRQLSKAMARQLSPATLRNIMADLEDLGFLSQPHTSAGRIPTDRAYRLYVDMLDPNRARLQPGQGKMFFEKLEPGITPSSLVVQTSSLLSKQTGYAAIFTLPNMEKSIFKHIELVHLHGHTVLAILVSESGLIQQRVVTTEKEMNQEELQKISRIFNEEFAGASLREIRARVLELMQEEKRLYDQLLADALEIANWTFRESEEEDGDELRIEATSKMLRQPEFADVHRMQEVYRAFEHKSRLLQILDSCVDGESIAILIGSELDIPEVKDFTLISSSYKYGDRSLGSVGVLGPMRMDYPQVTAWVGFAGQMLSQIISGKEDLSLD